MTAGNYLPKTFWAAACVGMAFLFAGARPPYRIGITPIGFAWLLVNAWTVASFAWGAQARVGFERWLSMMLLPTLAYLIALRSRFWESRLFHQAYCGVFALIGLIGCLQFILPINFLKPWFPEQNFLDWITSTGLPSALFGNRSYAGLYLCVSLPFVVWVFFRAKGWEMILPLAAMTLGLAFLVFTRSRASWLSLALAFGFLAVCGAGRRAWQRRGNLRVLVITLVAVGAVGILLHPSSRTRSQSQGAMPVYKETVFQSLKTIWADYKADKRWQMWQSVLAVGTSPLHGCGFGSFPIVATPLNETGRVYTLNWEVHCDVLQFYVDLGFAGLGLMALFWFWLLVSSFRQRRYFVCAVAGSSVLAFLFSEASTFISEKVCTQVWMAGMVAIVNSRAAKSPWKSIPISPYLQRLIRVATSLFLFVFAVVVCFSIWGDRQFTLERNKLAVKQKPNLRRLAVEVLPLMQFDPNTIHMNSHLAATLAHQLKELDAAELLAHRAVYLHPNDYLCLEILGIAAAYKENWGAAVGYFERVAAIMGKGTGAAIWKNLAVCYEKAGRHDKAVEALTKSKEKEVKNGAAETEKSK